MKENLIKVKKFVEKHDEIFVTILIFIMSFRIFTICKNVRGRRSLEFSKCIQNL